MVIIIRSNDIISDPRAMKYVKYLDDTKQDYYLIGWDREGKMRDSDRVFYYHHLAGYNVGGMQAVKNRVGWMRFVVKTLRSLSLDKCVLHACDLDSVFPSVVYSRLFGRGREATLIFDVFDWFSATLYDQSWLVLQAFKLMEGISVKNSDYIVICEAERIEQIPIKIPSNKIKVLPNIPYFSDSGFLRIDEDLKFNNNLITFSYVGGFAPTRCLDEIITIAEHGFINLSIAGYGDSQIEQRLIGLNGHPNIKYYGKVKYTDGLQIMYNSDVIYAMYSKVSPNNVYAAPNKYYEAMFLGKPLFSTKGTIVEKKVLKNQIGFVSEESEDDIKNEIDMITKEKSLVYAGNAHLLWVNKYSHYTSDWLINEYQSIIDAAKK